MSIKKEESVMAMYRETRPGEFVGEPDTIHHVAWSLLTIAVGLILWLGIALINVENQRNALMNQACQDRVFPAEVDTHCLARIETRAHWWQHVRYALGHLHP